MSKLMLVFGVLFLAVGVALGFLIIFQPGQMQVLALTPDVSALFIVGGALCLGLGNVAGALRESPFGAIPATIPEVAQTGLVGSTPATPKFKGFGSKATTATAAVVAAEVTEAAAEPAAVATTSVAETISALEKAKSDIALALGVETHEVVPPHVEPEPAPVAALVITPAAEPVVAAAEVDEAGEEGDLYVIEEKVIRGRPARILSDGTVEAETDEGWMRFENLEHLDEYLDAMVPEA